MFGGGSDEISDGYLIHAVHCNPGVLHRDVQDRFLFMRWMERTGITRHARKLMRSRRADVPVMVGRVEEA